MRAYDAADLAHFRAVSRNVPELTVPEEPCPVHGSVHADPYARRRRLPCAECWFEGGSAGRAIEIPVPFRISAAYLASDRLVVVPMETERYVVDHFSWFDPETSTSGVSLEWRRLR